MREDTGSGITQAEYNRQKASAAAAAAALKKSESMPVAHPNGPQTGMPPIYAPPAVNPPPRPPGAPSSPPQAPPGTPGPNPGAGGGEANAGNPTNTAPFDAAAQAAALARNYLAEFGITDSEVTSLVNDAFAKGESVDQVLAAVRGTKWYAATYPGIFQGIANGLITNEADYRAQLNSVNQLYNQYYGRNVGVDEFGQYIKKGQSISTISKTLQRDANAAVLGKQGMGSLFSDSDLSQIGAYQAGLPNSTAQYLNDLYGYARNVNPLYSQYGQTLDRTTLEGLYKSGNTATQVGQHLSGQSYVAANQNDLQYAAGAFGDGTLTPDQLSAYGDQKAGLSSPLGDKIALRVQQAQDRLQRVFSGTLASPSLSGSGGTLRNSNQVTPDLGA